MHTTLPQAVLMMKATMPKMTTPEDSPICAAAKILVEEGGTPAHFSAVPDTRSSHSTAARPHTHHQSRRGKSLSIAFIQFAFVEMVRVR